MLPRLDTSVARFRFRNSHCGWIPVFFLFGLVVPGTAASAADLPAGAKIYAEHCARCHGAQGEGTEDYPSPLRGDRSVNELARLIEKTMPEDSPEKCTGEDAAAVAAYLHDSFYSVLAQERNRPATIEFSRLTGRQYLNAAADLIGSFRGAGDPGSEHGLHGRYFHSRRLGERDLAFSRNDPVVNFQFGSEKPEGLTTEPAPEENPEKKQNAKEKAEAEAKRLNFGISWEGSIYAPVTGDYEFLVRSENGVRLWVNDHENALIDASIKSGDETDFRGTIKLLGGRYYPIKLNFYRYREPNSSVQLLWKPPHRVLELIPERNLFTKPVPPTFVVTRQFPPDDRSTGYERGTSVPREWLESATDAALETASYVVQNLPRLARTSRKNPEEDDAKLRTFCKQFVERAFRRPINEEDQKIFIDAPLAAAGNSEDGVKRVVLLTLLSPRFLYREGLSGGFDDYDVASWLSFGLWDSLPDSALWSAAAKKELQSRDQLEKQISRMLQDGRSRAKQREFLHQWLQIDRFADMAKDSTTYPDFSDEIESDLRISLELFIDEILTSEKPDFRELLLSDALYVNGRLAAFYGFDLPADAPFQRLTISTQPRAGVMTHPLLMSGFAYEKTTSPIHRGVFLARSLLGRRLKPPPEAVPPLSPALHADLNTRERVLLQTSPAACQSCHSMINPLGFSLENFDAVGRYRELEQNRPLDVQGSYIDRTGATVEFAGARELAKFLADSPETHEAFVTQLFQFLIKQPIRAFGPDEADQLRHAFVAQDCNIQQLVSKIMADSALTARELKHRPASDRPVADR